MNVTPEQVARADKFNAATLELLSLDARTFTRQDHIDTAVELLTLHGQGIALAVEVVGDDLDRLGSNVLSDTVKFQIDAHLRIAEALR